jgi:fibronectin-binding autotransporter adhesin
MIRPTLFAALLFATGTSLFGQAFPNWNGTTADWSNTGNWTGGNASSYGQLEFKGAGVTTTNNDISGLSQWRLYFQNGAAYTLNGNAVNLFDFGGAHSWVLNDASASQTINFDVNFAATAGATFGQVSARSSGNLTMGNIGITGSQVAQVRFAGESSGAITVGGVISGTGKQVVIGLNQVAADQASTVVNFNGANTYTGDTFIVAGKLVVGSSGSIASGSTLQLGQTTGTAAATLEYGATSGGQTIANNLTVRSGSSGTKTLSILNTSGTQTFTGAVTLNDNLTLSAAAGAQTFNTSGFDLTNKTLTVNTAGTTTLGNAVTSSLGTGGVLIKDGAGTLVLSSTSNNYTGTTNTALSTNGTRINAGTLAIAGDGSLGLAPSTAATNVQFTGNGTLRFDAATTLGATRNISVGAGLTATFNNNGNAVTIGGIIGGATGATTFSGSGTTTLTGTNTASGTVTINSGSTLQLGNGGATGTVAGAITNDGTLAFNRGGLHNFTNNIGGTGSLTKDGTNTLVLSGTNTYSGGTTVNSGVLQIGNSTTTGTMGTGAVVNNASIVFNRSNVTSTFSNSISGTGTLTKTNGQIVVLTGNNTYSGDTIISAGTLVIGSGGANGTLGSGNVLMSPGASLSVNRTGSLTISGAISGDGSFSKSGSSVLALSSNNSYTGTTTINSGTLEIGSGGTTGTLGSGNVTNNAALAFNRSDSITVANTISGSGTVAQNGSGTTILTSSSNSYSGATTVSAGTLQVNVNDALGTNAAGTTVSAGGSLKLNGVNYSTAEALTINGTGAGGSGALTNSGTSTYAGAITAATNARISAGGGTLTLTGGLVKDGTTLTLTGGGSININGTGISGASANSDLVVDGTSVTLNATSTYNGPTFIRNGGTLIAAVANALPTSPRSALSLDDSGTGSSALTIQANVQMASLTGVSTSSVSSSLGTTVTIGTSSGSTLYDGSFSGSGSLVKDGASTQIFSGNFTHTGGTTISAGTLQIGNNNSEIGNIGSGGFVNNGNLDFRHDLSRTVSGTISGSGNVSFDGLTGLGETYLTGNNSYAGTTTIGFTNVFIGNGGTSGTLGTGDVVTNGVLLFNRSDTHTVANNIGGLGAAGAYGTGTTILTGNNTFGTTGITTGATLQIGDGGTTGTLGVGDVLNDGALIFNRSNSMTINGQITGAGSVTQSGIGSTILTGNNTYSGGTTLDNGTLEVNNTTGSGTGSGDVIVNAGAALAGTGSITIDSGNQVYIGGNFVVGSTSGAPTAADFTLSTTGPGTLLNVDTTGVLKFDLFTGAGGGNNTAIPTAADILRLQGNAIFATGSLLEISNPSGMSAWAAGDSWLIWDTTNTGTLAGTLDLSAPVLGGGLSWDFNQSTGILSIVGVPEPSRALLLLSGLFGLALRRRR